VFNLSRNIEIKIRYILIDLVLPRRLVFIFPYIIFEALLHSCLELPGAASNMSHLGTALSVVDSIPLLLVTLVSLAGPLKPHHIRLLPQRSFFHCHYQYGFARNDKFTRYTFHQERVGNPKKEISHLFAEDRKLTTKTKTKTEAVSRSEQLVAKKLVHLQDSDCDPAWTTSNRSPRVSSFLRSCSWI